jgi:curved DNA-binding protein CbpA
VRDVTQRPFVDYYEVLQLSQTADAETVERVYRLLAKRYHPDNQETGNSHRFAEVHEAYEALSEPKRRAEYDVRYDENRSMQWKIFDQGTAADGREEDRRIFHGILSLLYVARRRDPVSGGLGTVNLEKLLGVPRQHLEFPVWYLKQRGWIERLDNGQFAITVSGVDKLADRELSLPEDRLLAASSLVESKAKAQAQADAQIQAGATAAQRGPQTAASPVGHIAAQSPSPQTPSRPAGGPGGFPAEETDEESLRAVERANEVAERLRGVRR